VPPQHEEDQQDRHAGAERRSHDLAQDTFQVLWPRMIARS
jgi:hypothetical protein